LHPGATDIQMMITARTNSLLIIQFLLYIASLLG
jgi:hypothetical protein